MDKRDFLPGGAQKKLARGVQEVLGLSPGPSVKRTRSGAQIIPYTLKRVSSGVESRLPQKRSRTTQLGAYSLPQVAPIVSNPMVYGRSSSRRRSAKRVKRTRRRIAGRRKRYTKRLSERISRLSKACDPTLALPVATVGGTAPYNFNMTEIVTAQSPDAVPFHDMVGQFQLPTASADGSPYPLIRVTQDDERGRDDLCITPLRHRFLINMLWERKYDTTNNYGVNNFGNIPVPTRVELWVVKADAGKNLYTQSDEKEVWNDDHPYCDLYRSHPSGQFLPEQGGTCFAERGMMLDLFARTLRQFKPDPYFHNDSDLGLMRDHVRFVKRKIWRNVLPYGWTRRQWDMMKATVGSTSTAATIVPERNALWPTNNHRELAFNLRLKQKEVKFLAGGQEPQGKYAQYYAFICAAPEVDCQYLANVTAGGSTQRTLSHGCLPQITMYHAFEFKQ